MDNPPPNPLMPSSALPRLAGYELRGQITRTPDGEIWEALHPTAGACPLVLLEQEALEDPGAIFRLKQELGRHPGHNPTRMVVVNPPLPADKATNLQQLRTGRSAERIATEAVERERDREAAAAQPRRRDKSAERLRRDRRTLILLGVIISLSLLLAVAAYVGIMYYVFRPVVQNQEQRAKALGAMSNAASMSIAVDRWALENSIPDGTTYTWGEISDYMPAEFHHTPPPVDPFGRPYTFHPAGGEVEVHPDTERVLHASPFAPSTSAP